LNFDNAYNRHDNRYVAERKNVVDFLSSQSDGFVCLDVQLPRHNKQGADLVTTKNREKRVDILVQVDSANIPLLFIGLNVHTPVEQFCRLIPQFMPNRTSD